MKPDYTKAREYWGGKIPARVKMLKDVHSDLPFIKPALVVYRGFEYEVSCNPFGALSAYVNNEQLGLKPDEFEVVEWW